MSDNANHYDMNPMTGEEVEVHGVYENESGQEAELQRGDKFPADLVLGATEWKLTEYQFDNHHDGETDPRLVPKKDKDKPFKVTHPRRHLIRGDR